MDKNSWLLYTTMKVTRIWCSFFSSSLLLGAAELCADTGRSSQWGWREENATFSRLLLARRLEKCVSGTNFSVFGASFYCLTFLLWCLLATTFAFLFWEVKFIISLTSCPMGRNVFVLARAELQMRPVLGTVLCKSRGRGNKQFPILFETQF